MTTQVLQPSPIADADSLGSAAALFHSFGDPSRLVILLHLQLGEHRVVDLMAHLGLSQSTVSKHLACLKDAGIVTVRPEGRASVYSLAHPGALVHVFAATEKLLALTGAVVTLCPVHGAETVARKS